MLKALPPGSVYSELGGVEHFTQTADTAVVVQISGYGPTDTKYFDPAHDPSAKTKGSDKVHRRKKSVIAAHLTPVPSIVT